MKLRANRNWYLAGWLHSLPKLEHHIESAANRALRPGATHKAGAHWGPATIGPWIWTRLS